MPVLTINLANDALGGGVTPVNPRVTLRRLTEVVRTVGGTTYIVSPTDIALNPDNGTAVAVVEAGYYWVHRKGGPSKLVLLDHDARLDELAALDPATLDPTAPATVAGWDVALADRPTRAEVAADYLPKGDRSGVFDARTSLYNASAAPLRPLRTALGKARTGLCRIAFLGDSVTAGAGATQPGSTDPASQLRPRLQAAGYAVGELLWLANSSGGDSRVTLSAGWVPGTTGFPFLYSSTNGSTLTYTSAAAGTVVEIFHANSSASFTYAIDGGAPVAVNGAGVQGTVLRTITGLANTAHTVVITQVGATETFIGGVGVRSATGVVLVNAGIGGSTSGDWAGSGDWYGSLGAVDALAPDVILVELGLNDGFYGTVPAATFTANLATILGHFADVAAILVAPHVLADPYHSAIYDLADARALPLLDLRDRIGGDVTVTAGITGDGVHFTAQGNGVKAAAWAAALTA